MVLAAIRLVEGMVKVMYDHRIGGGEELVGHEKEVSTHQDVCQIIDNYPWAAELAWFKKLGIGGGFNFLLGDENSQYAHYQFVPIDADVGFLTLSVVLKPGVFKLFGRKSVSKDFDMVSIAEAKVKLNDLFTSSIATLYNRYQR